MYPLWIPFRERRVLSKLELCDEKYDRVDLVAGLALLTGVSGCTKAGGIILTDLGTRTPPSTLGGISVTRFAADLTAIGTNETSLATPTGARSISARRSITE